MQSRMNLGDLNKVWEVKALKKPGEEEAKQMLEKIAKQVQPIMRKRKWTVKILSEFCPNNPSLLGLNVGGGEEVKLRLRRPNRDWEFFPFHQVLDTMLHELCHNVHAPHNAAFYNLWDQLRKECEELVSKGISGTGKGFDLPGRRLGGFSPKPLISSLHQTALAAAENRARFGSLLPSGPKRLGGDSDIMVALSPIQAAAMAAERRLQDEIWCGSQAINNESVCSGNESKLGYENGFSERFSTSHSLPQSSSSSSASLGLNCDSPSRVPVSSMWECGTCTLLNPLVALVCEACGVEKPRDIGTKQKVWSCKFCTLENSVKADRCSACDQWRYSYGVPLSAPAPNVGT